MTLSEGKPTSVCIEEGAHDFMMPVVVRQGPFIFFGRVEAAVVFCRRCGVSKVAGWTGEEDV